MKDRQTDRQIIGGMWVPYSKLQLSSTGGKTNILQIKELFIDKQ